jgi:hypothetical protein
LDGFQFQDKQGTERKVFWTLVLLPTFF